MESLNQGGMYTTQSTYSDIIIRDLNGHILQTLLMRVDMNGNIMSVTLPTSSMNILVPTSSGIKAPWQLPDTSGNMRDIYLKNDAALYYNNVYNTGDLTFDLAGMLVTTLGPEIDAMAINLYNENPTRWGDAQASDSLLFSLNSNGISGITIYMIDVTQSQNTIANVSNILVYILIADNESCFCEDTQILCADGTIQPIQSLCPGTLVQTLTNGPKKVVTVGKRNLLYTKICNYEQVGLKITEKHGVLVDRLTHAQENIIKGTYGSIKMIEGKYVLPAIFDSMVTTTTLYINLPVYHIVLESDDGDEAFGVCANTRWVESCSMNDYLKYSGMTVINETI